MSVDKLPIFTPVFETCSSILLPVITVRLPVIIVFVFTSSPLFGDMLADTLPELICDKFNPVIPLAGIPERFAPEPLNEPLKEPLPPKAKELVVAREELTAQLEVIWYVPAGKNKLLRTCVLFCTVYN